MKISELEKNIPLPKGKSKIHPLIFKQVERMEVGDSFIITLDDEREATSRGIGCALGRKYKNSKFKCYQVDEKRIRIWRME